MKKHNKYTRIIRHFLMRDDHIERAAFFWNAFAAVTNAFQTMVLLLIITRLGNMNDASIFVMAYAIGNLMLNIGKYGARQFQVTDAAEKYSFEEYARSRYATMLLMLLGSAAYLGYGIVVNNYSAEKIGIVVLICLLKGLEALEDVYHGRMQQMGRLDVSGRIFGIRMAVFIAQFGIFYIATQHLLFSCAASVLVTFVLFLVLNFSVFDVFRPGQKQGVPKNHWRGILVECFPLCLCVSLNMYITNAPKYTIDAVVSDEEQAYFNIIFMAVFVIGMVSSFIFQPLLKWMGEIWEKREHNKFFVLVMKLIAVTAAGDIVILAAGCLIGCEVLGWMYGIDLSSYKGQLAVFLLSGGMIALQNLFLMAITVIRCQKYMVYGYIVTAAGMLLMGKHILMRHGLIGLDWFYFFMLAVLTIYCAVITFAGIKRQSRRQGEKEGQIN